MQNTTVVNMVGGQTATAVATAAVAVSNATSNNMPNTLVLRDSSGDFATNMVTIDGTTTNPTDAATKAYVDAAVSTGFTVHPAALVTSEINISPLSGFQTIDGVTVSEVIVCC